MAHFRSLDLNLLRVLDALLEERSVTRAASRLGLTQSAVSHALQRLRHALEDDLFLRAPGGVQPTPRAVEIGAGVRRALQQLQGALEPADFAPEDSERRFTLGSSSYVFTLLMPGVMARFRTAAPRAEMRLRGTPDAFAEELDSGRLDVAVGSFARTPARFGFERLFSERLVWAVRADHPAAAGPLTIERLAALPHLVLSTAEDEQVMAGSVVDHGLERRVIWDDGGVLQAELAARGLSRLIGLAAPDAHSALAIAARTDMAALVPERLGALFAQVWGLKLLTSPYASPAIDVGMVWRRDHDGPPQAWLRELLRQAAGDLCAPAVKV